MKHWPSALVNIRAVHYKEGLSPVWGFLMRFPVKNLWVQTTLSYDPFRLNPISSKFQTWDGRGWFYFRYLGTFFGSRGIVGCWIEILGVRGYDNDVFFEFRLSQRFRISSVASSLSCSLIYLYIWSILSKIIHASLVSLCLALLLLMCDTFTNPALIFFLCISQPSSIPLTRFITERVYLDDEFSVIYIVGCHTLTSFMKKFSLAPNVLT